MKPLEILFAPDWRSGVPYQRLLGEALDDCGVHVSYLADYRRGLPLWRLLSAWRRDHACDLLHLHWPEAYYPQHGNWLDWARLARFALDLRLARRGIAVAVTAHNLHAHNREREPFAFRNARTAFCQADVVFAHSAPAKALLIEKYGLEAAKIELIAHGDLSVVLGPRIEKGQAREELGLGSDPLCLMFGAVEPYKGLEEAMTWWHKHRPACRLWIVGKPCSEEYAEQIKAAAADGESNIRLELGWLSDGRLRQWLSAADCVLFNYRTVFTSGAANLARAYGVPQLLPYRLETVVLDEPHPSVQRFESLEEDFAEKLSGAIASTANYESAATWREEHSWARVAERTAAAYRRVTG